jgi:hypothetical protein
LVLQDVTGRMSKWAVELGALNIDFKPQISIKSQALVDFILVPQDVAERVVGDDGDRVLLEVVS